MAKEHDSWLGGLGVDVGAVLNKVADKTANTIDSATKKVEGAYDDAKHKVETTYDDAKQKVETAYDDTKKKVETTYDNTKKKVETAFDDTKKKVETTYDDAKKKVGGVYDDTKKKIGGTYDDAKKKVGGAYDDAKKKVAGTGPGSGASGGKGKESGQGGSSEGLTFIVEWGSDEFGKWGEASKVKGGFKVKAKVKGEISLKASGKSETAGITSGGGTAEKELATQKTREILNSLTMKEAKETFNCTLSKKKIDISIGVKVTLQTDVPWLSPVLTGTFVIVGAEWEKLDKNPNDFTGLGVEFGGVSQFKGEFDVGSKFKASVTGEFGVVSSVKPNWTEIIKEAGKKVAEEVAEKGADTVVKETAGDAVTEASETALTETAEAVVVDEGAVASAAATVVLPLAAAAAIGYGFYQESKNMKANAEAIQTALATRRRATAVAVSYAGTMTGDKSKGDEGSKLADAEIARIMTETHASREQVTNAVSKAQGGYQSIRDTQLKRLKDKLYDDACRMFDEAHKKDFGILEKLGETWGFRGSFRSMLRLVLYADD